MKQMIKRLKELYDYRELLRNLVVRDLKVRYKNSVLGVLWSLLNPLAMTLVFTVVFTLMVPNQGQPNYPVFFLCGFLPWSLLNETVTGATGSIVNNSSLIKKVFFPREVLPLSEVLSSLVNFLVALIVLFGMIFVFSMQLTWAVLMLPLIILAELMFITGLAFVLATANVFYRDTEHITSVVLRAWFFLTPIFYSIDVLPEQQQILGMVVDIRLWTRRLNPMASLIASYRDVLYYGVFSGPDFFLRTLFTCFILMVLGYLVFYRFSSRFGEEA